MSSEPIQNIEIRNPSHVNIETIGSSASKKVDINVLLNRVRQEKLKQKKESLVFFWCSRPSYNCYRINRFSIN